MPASINVICFECMTTAQFPADAAGARVTCANPECGASFVVPTPKKASSAAPPEASSFVRQLAQQKLAAAFDAPAGCRCAKCEGTNGLRYYSYFVFKDKRTVDTGGASRTTWTGVVQNGDYVCADCVRNLSTSNGIIWALVLSLSFAFAIYVARAIWFSTYGDWLSRSVCGVGFGFLVFFIPALPLFFFAPVGHCAGEEIACACNRERWKAAGYGGAERGQCPGF